MGGLTAFLLALAQLPQADRTPSYALGALPPSAALEGAVSATLDGETLLLGGALGARAWRLGPGGDWSEVELPEAPGWDPLIIETESGLLLAGGRDSAGAPHRPGARLLRRTPAGLVSGAAPMPRLPADALPLALWPPGGPRSAAARVMLPGGGSGVALLAPRAGGGAGLWIGDPATGSWSARAAPPAGLARPWLRVFGPSHLLAGDRDSAAVFAWHLPTDTWVGAGNLSEPPGARPLHLAASRAPETASLGIADAALLLGYLALVLVIGGRYARRERSSSDWFVAGGRIPAWAAGFSILATQISAITFLSTPAVAFATDWSLLPSWFGMLLFAPIAAYVFLPAFRRLRAPTAYSWLEDRFGPAVRVFGASSFLVFQLARMGVVTYLPALAVSHATGLPHEACILICGAVAILYTVLGGMEAVVWTDVLQAFAIFGGAAAAIVVLVAGAGGPAETWEAAAAAGKTRAWNPSWSLLTDSGWLVLAGGFFLQFGPYSADQAIVQRYMTTRDAPSAARAIWLNGLLSAPVGFLFLVVGACLWAWFRAHPGRLEIGMAADEVFPLFLTTGLPPGVGGLILAALAAAAMSTLDSGMHSCATVMAHDFWLRGRKAEVEDARVLRVARRLAAAAGLIGTGIALALAAGEVQSLLLFFLKVLGLVMSGVAGVFSLGMLDRRARSADALAGAAACTALLAWLAFGTSVHLFLYPLAGIPACVAAGMLSARLRPSGR